MQGGCLQRWRLSPERMVDVRSTSYCWEVNICYVTVRTPEANLDVAINIWVNILLRLRSQLMRQDPLLPWPVRRWSNGPWSESFVGAQLWLDMVAA